MKEIGELDEEKCWKFSRSHLECSKKTSEDIEKLIEHSKKVKEICKSIAGSFKKSFNDEIDWERLRNSAILHDIAKFDDKYLYDITKFDDDEWEEIKKSNKDDCHHILAKCILKVKYKSGGAFSIIKAHKGDFNPKNEVAYEAAILRIADKIAKIYKGKSVKEVEESYKASMVEIEKYFKKKEFEKLKDIFDKVYTQHIFC